MNPKKEIRLQKMLAECGVSSRRKAEELIKSGVVKVNGKVATIGDKVDKIKDKVTVNNKKIIVAKNFYYIMLYKPRGYITTMSDEMGRKCVKELVSDIPLRVYPVGRLDRESEGLLLMTNDGEFANRLTHPSKHVPKTYRVTVNSKVNEEQLNKISSGIEIDGKVTAPAFVNVESNQDGRSVLNITIYEGRNRQIRKMCEALNLDVLRLKRTSIGMLKLGMLRPGKWRELTKNEVEKIDVNFHGNNFRKED